MSKEEKRPIIVKKVVKKSAGHHGGAWKVAYADFVTAMMAFFLLLWLLNVATSDAKNLISSYFDPSHPKVSSMESGAGGVMGGLSMSTRGSMAQDIQPLAVMTATGKLGDANSKKNKSQNNQVKSDLKKLEEELRSREEERFRQAKQELEKAMAQDKELAALADHLKIDITPEGLRIQIIDQHGEPMFPSGSADMYPNMRLLVEQVGKVISKMPNPISVRGHTDSNKYRTGAVYTNWELSADRANASRRVLSQEDIPESRFSDVMGKADIEPLTDNPQDAQNRRITVLLKREDIVEAIARGEFSDTVPPSVAQNISESAEAAKNAPAAPSYEKTQGEYYFP